MNGPTPRRIDTILSLIEEIWAWTPEQSFGDVITRALGASDVQVYTDESLIAALEAYKTWIKEHE